MLTLAARLAHSAHPTRPPPSLIALRSRLDTSTDTRTRIPIPMRIRIPVRTRTHTRIPIRTRTRIHTRMRTRTGMKYHPSKVCKSVLLSGGLLKCLKGPPDSDSDRPNTPLTPTYCFEDENHDHHSDHPEAVHHEGSSHNMRGVFLHVMAV